jgi:hypothetical protein
MDQIESGTIMAEADRQDQLRDAIERELVAEASAADRRADADGVQMHTLLPQLPNRQS